MFVGNAATNNDTLSHNSTVQFSLITISNQIRAGEGGGINIQFRGYAQNNTIEIVNCCFHNNSAQYGGGVYLLLQDNACDNAISISGCTFTHNSAPERSGGALTIGNVVGPVVSNSITVLDTIFTQLSGEVL